MIIIYSIILVIVLLVLVLLVTRKQKVKEEGFFFEVTPGKDRWCCDKGGYYGRPVSFEYTPDAERSFQCANMKEEEQKYNFGWDGLLGKNMRGIEEPELGIPETIKNCAEKRETGWNLY